MATRSILDTLPGAIKDELIEKILNRENHKVITQWLFEKHGIKTSKSSFYRFSKTTINKFDGLVKLGMPPKNIGKNRILIEARGVGLVEQELLDKLAEKNGPLFAFLDETEGGQ